MDIVDWNKIPDGVSFSQEESISVWISWIEILYVMDIEEGSIWSISVWISWIEIHIPWLYSIFFPSISVWISWIEITGLLLMDSWRYGRYLYGYRGLKSLFGWEEDGWLTVDICMDIVDWNPAFDFQNSVDGVDICMDIVDWNVILGVETDGTGSVDICMDIVDWNRHNRVFYNRICQSISVWISWIEISQW